MLLLPGDHCYAGARGSALAGGRAAATAAPQSGPPQAPHLVRRFGCLRPLLRVSKVPLRLRHPLLPHARRAAQLGQPRPLGVHVAARL